MAKRNWELEEENEELETRLSLSISMYEGDRSPMHKLEEENAGLRNKYIDVLNIMRDSLLGVAEVSKRAKKALSLLTEQEPE